ncbi:MAG: hypothetical protein RI903_1465 [Bacteroidota bacterium]
MDITFKAINDPTRRDILVFLTQGPQNAGEIAKQFSMTKPSISHHLDLLKQGELISAEKKRAIHSLFPKSIWFRAYSCVVSRIFTAF